MLKRSIAILALVCVLFALLAACNSNKAITGEEAEEIVMKHAGVTESQVSDVHTHVTTNDEGVACYSIHITINGTSYEYMVHGVTGEILSYGEGGH